MSVVRAVFQILILGYVALVGVAHATAAEVPAPAPPIYVPPFYDYLCDEPRGLELPKGIEKDPEGLYEAGRRAGRLVGTAVERPPDHYVGEPLFLQTMAAQFGLLTSYGLSPECVHPAPGVWRFEYVDQIIAFARANDMAVKGHPLVFGDDEKPAPGYDTRPYVRDEWDTPRFSEAVREHVRTLVARYANEVRIWDVVNEAFDNDGNVKKSAFWHRMGPDYIAQLFEVAHKANPNATLVLNDYNIEWLDKKSDGLYAAVSQMKKDGVPIHAVGFQMHLSVDDHPTREELTENFQRFADLDVEIHITEMDVNLDVEGCKPREACYDRQRDVYRAILDVCMRQPKCTTISFWGFTDRHTWLEELGRVRPDPLPYDRDYGKKPAYFGILDALTGR